MEKKYSLTVGIVDPTNSEKKKVLMYECTLYTDKYNHSYIHVENDKWAEIFNTSYRDGQEIQAVVNWACNFWTGENGAWKLQGVNIEEVE